MKSGTLFVALVSTIFFAAGELHAVDPSPQVRIVTPVGAITLELDPVNAPVTTANFLRYVDEGFYNGGQFFRTVTEENQPFDTVKIAVIQGGANAERSGDAYPPIVLERTGDTGLAHQDGTISMARSEADTATHSFFICVGDQPELDYGGARNPDGQGFAAFGHVVEGIEVVRAINSMPAAGQSLEPPVLIERVVRLH